MTRRVRVRDIWADTRPAIFSQMRLEKTTGRRVPVISLSVQRVYDIIASSANDKGLAGMSYAEIAERAQMSKTHVCRAVHRLIGLKLILASRGGTGRGASFLFVIRVLWAALKRGVKRVLGAASKARRVFHRETFPLAYPYDPGSEHPNPEDAARCHRPSQIMGALRCVVSANDSLEPSDRRTILSCMGRMLFRRGGFDAWKRCPEGLSALFISLRHGRPASMPAPGSSGRRVFGWAQIHIRGILQQHSAGHDPRALLSQLIDDAPTAPEPPADTGRPVHLAPVDRLQQQAQKRAAFAAAQRSPDAIARDWQRQLTQEAMA